jgi:adenylate kinase family enzyme
MNSSVLRDRRRILIIGPGGAGKSTLARSLGRATGLPVIHLDQIYWRPGWAPAPDDEFVTALRRVMTGERWIIDGNYSSSLAARVHYCDAIVWLDPPPLVCLAGVLDRWIRNRGRARPDVPAGCPERLSWDFIKWIWLYRTRSAPTVQAIVDGARAKGKTVVHVRSRRAAARLVDGAGA